MSTLTVVGYVLGAILILILLTGIRFIPNNRIGVIEKRFSGKGSVKSGFIAMNDEAGYQPRILRGGLHYLMPIQYVVHTMPLVTISQGKVGYIFARDGKQLDPAQVSGFECHCDRFSGCGKFPQERRTTRTAAPHFA